MRRAQFHGLVPGLGFGQNIRCSVVKTREAPVVVASTGISIARTRVVAASNPNVDRITVFIGNIFQVRARCAVDVFQPTTGILRWDL